MAESVPPPPEQPNPEPYKETPRMDPVKFTVSRFGTDSSEGEETSDAPDARAKLESFLARKEDPAQIIERVAKAINGVDVEKANALKGVIEATTPRVSFDSLPVGERLLLLQSFRAAERSLGGKPRTLEEAKRVIEDDINAYAAAKPQLDEFLKKPNISEEEYRRKTEEILTQIQETQGQVNSSAPNSTNNSNS